MQLVRKRILVCGTRLGTNTDMISISIRTFQSSSPISLVARWYYAFHSYIRSSTADSDSRCATQVACINILREQDLRSILARWPLLRLCVLQLLVLDTQRRLRILRYSTFSTSLCHSYGEERLSLGRQQSILTVVVPVFERLEEDEHNSERTGHHSQ